MVRRRRSGEECSLEKVRRRRSTGEGASEMVREIRTGVKHDHKMCRRN